MRIKMTGAYNLYAFEEAMDGIVQSFRSNSVHELRSINIDLQPFCHDRLVEFEDLETGGRVKNLVYHGSRRREFKIVSPRLQPEREAQPIAAVIRKFEGPPPQGNIEQFIGLLEDEPCATDARSSAGAAGRCIAR